MMKKYLICGIAAAVILSACGGSKKDNAAVLNDKKAALEKLKKERTSTDEKIRQMEKELSTLDTSSDANINIKLVSAAPVAIRNFMHYIELQARIDADNVSYISPRGQGGQVKAIYVKEGDHVSKGQLVLKLDDAIVQQQIAAAKQQMEGIKTQLNFAKTISQRQQNLWNQGIGTEVQLISAKKDVESLENQLKFAEEQVKVAVEQLKTTYVYSDVAGIADLINVKVGELFSGVSAAGPQIKIVNNNSLKAVANVPENYTANVHKGSPVIVNVADLNKQFSSNIFRISQSIDITQRGFVAEAKVPSDPSLKPNQLAVMKILDYSSPNAVVAPVNTVQTDEKGKYIFVMEKLSNGKFVARKKVVVVGEVYGTDVEVKAGLTAEDKVITEGYQNLYEGQVVSPTNQ